MRYHFMRIFSAVSLFGVATAASAQSHSYINRTRSSTQNHVFISQSVEGEYGTYKKKGAVASTGTTPESMAPATTPAKTDSTENWQGSGFKTALGVEVLKFVQISASHTFVNTHSKEDSSVNMHGSRLSGEAQFIFQSPLGNLQAVGGLLGSRMDFQNGVEGAGFYGSGYFYSLGVNYFLDYKLSVFADLNISHEHLVRNSGSALVDDYVADMTGAGVGFSLWL